MSKTENCDVYNDISLPNSLIVDCDGDMVDAFVAPDVHPDYILSLPKLERGDLVSTSDGKIGLVIAETASNKQGVLFYRIMIENKEMYYSLLQLKKIDGASK